MTSAIQHWRNPVNPRRNVVIKGPFIVAALMASGCDRPSPVTPAATTPALPPEVQAEVTRQLQSMPRLQREGNNPSIRMTEEVRPFIGVWYDEESDLDCITIIESSPGVVTVTSASNSEAMMVVDSVVLKDDCLAYDTAMFWLIEPPHPWLADAEGMRMRCELRIAADNPDCLIMELTTSVPEADPEPLRLNRRAVAGGE